eukprot:TRINITY_DN3909_c0_g1_i1.p1 TRINITY_DN3909_c0_g1~~TRINITY_DN3909_c0_g1_i1.p1  ORF type:complete len:199 (-),score=4.14 TRINITY_DN3909_c0_g1_i1:461-1057(-)
MPISSPSSPSNTSYATTSQLFPGSLFKGEQRSERSVYPVTVVLQHVDLEKSLIVGFLTISGLIERHPSITTFFEAEVIGDRYSFLTRKWEADETVDRKHWERFPQFSRYSSTFNTEGFKLEPWQKQETLFMRWKEYFLVPDHNIKSIDGASFDGFYYICLQRTEGSLTGYYYHKNSELFQCLKLKHVPQRSFPTIEMR